MPNPRNLFLFTLVLLIQSFSLKAQAPAIQWQKCLGGASTDDAVSIKQTTEGGYILLGRSDSNDGDVSGNHGSWDFWLTKIDNFGSLIWQKSLGGSDEDWPASVEQTSDSGYIAVGYTKSNDGDINGNHGNTDIWVVKLTKTGDISWQKCLGGSKWEEAYSIQQTSDGGYILVGQASSSDGDVALKKNGISTDYWIVKLSSTGNIIWQKTLGGTNIDWANDVQQTTDGGYIVAGMSTSNDGDVSNNYGGWDYWIVKLTDIGTITWQKSLGGSGLDVAHSIQQTTDGGYIVAGRSESSDKDVTGNHGSTDLWVVKLSASGTITWQKSLGGSSFEVGSAVRTAVFCSVEQCADGAYIIAGFSESTDGDISGNHGKEDSWIIKLSANGTKIWQKSLGGSNYDAAMSIQQTSDKGYIIAGFTGSGDGDVSGLHGGADCWVVKLGAEYCTQPLQNNNKNFTSSSGTGDFNVNAGATCSWTAIASCSFVNIVNTQANFGNGTVSYTVSANSGPARTCEVNVEGQKFTITQDGCVNSIQAPSQSFTTSGGNATFSITGSCLWTAIPSCSFVTISSANSGNGNGTVSYTVSANSGPARTCEINVGDQKHTIFQTGCSYTLSPLAQNYSNASGRGSFTIKSTCAWTATSSCSFVTITSANSGSGNATVSYTVSANSGPARTCEINVGGQKHTITQNGCYYTLNPTMQSFSIASGQGSVIVNSTCAWTATSSCSFVTITSGNSGNGNGTVNYTVTANSGMARTCEISIGGQKHLITQAACSYTISPITQSYSAEGGSGDFAVTSPCTWTASASCSFVTITSGSGTGNGTVSYTVEPNSGPTRTCTLSVAGENHIITQSACEFTVSPQSQSFNASGGNGSFTITTTSNCSWTVSTCSYVTINSASSGTGNAAISYTMAPNYGLQRSCQIEAAGQKINITQAAVSCTYALEPNQAFVGALGGSGTFIIKTFPVCTWTATVPNCNYVKLTSASSGTGETTVSYTVSENLQNVRSCNIFVDNQLFTVNQEATCVKEITPVSNRFTAAGGGATITVDGDSACQWKANCSCSFVTIAPPVTGKGKGTFNYSVEANTGPKRNCTINVGYHPYIVFQDEEENGIESASSFRDIQLLPNPSSGKVTVKSGSPIRSISIKNTAGQAVHEMYKIFNTSIEIDLSHLQKGVYIMRISDGTYFTVKKLVIQ